MDAIGLSAQGSEFAAALIGIENIASERFSPIICIFRFRQALEGERADSETVGIGIEGI